MIVYYPPNHYLHQILEVINGVITITDESPERVEVIKSALQEHGGFIFKKPDICNEKLIGQVHDKDYLNFLKNSQDWQRLEFPSVSDYTKKSKSPAHFIAKKGFHIFDTYTPLTKNLWLVAKESASCAVSASNLLVGKKEKVVYALSRPPGHHATKNMAGGYCYLNNAAIATQNLINRGAKKIAILDIDFHHCNGTQDIFYQTNKVLTISIHADPNRKFPYFTGFKSEIGSGPGKGYNYNFPLPEKINDRQYLKILVSSIKIIKKYKPEYLVVSVGFDSYEKDPICDFSISLNGFNLIGKELSKLPYQTLLVQEGGYCLKDLGKCALSFLTPFL